jgi:hypothetical protein
MTGQNEEGVSELAAQAGAAHAEGEYQRVWALLQGLLKQREQGEAQPVNRWPAALKPGLHLIPGSQSHGTSDASSWPWFLSLWA